MPLLDDEKYVMGSYETDEDIYEDDENNEIDYFEK